MAGVDGGGNKDSNHPCSQFHSPFLLWSHGVQLQVFQEVISIPDDASFAGSSNHHPGDCGIRRDSTSGSLRCCGFPLVALPNLKVPLKIDRSKLPKRTPRTPH